MIRKEWDNMKTAPIQVTRSSMPPFEEYCTEIKELWDTRWLTNAGAKHREFENQLRRYLDSPNVELYTNGHMALEIAINALGLTGEVITTPFTFASTTQAILRNGLTPVFCDIEDKYYTLDPSKIETLITEKTSAIIPVHVYGNICDHEAIQRLADKYGLKVIYDAAHAFGESVNGVNVATLGDISMFSFHATKVFNSVEGGCLSYRDAAFHQKLVALREFGMIGKENAEYIGENAKMTEFHAAMGLCNLRHVGDYIASRKKSVERYRERLSGVSGIRLCPERSDVLSNYSYFPVVFDKTVFGKSRDDITDLLAKNNIFARKYFYPLTSDFDVCRHYNTASLPIAHSISESILTLPLFEGLSDENVDRICNIITK
mgnify:CR=1 FL=1